MLIEALSESGIAAHGRSGLNVFVPVAEEAAVVTALLQRAWAVTAMERWRIDSQPAVRITTATLRPTEAEQLAADVVDVIARRTGTYSA
jgi:hypothetical protein